MVSFNQNTSRNFAVAGLMMLVFVGSSLAQPTTQPGTSGARRGAFGAGGAGPLTLTQRQEAIAWAGLNMPSLQSLILQTPVATPRRNRLVTFAFTRMTNEQAAGDDAALKARVHKNIQDEDSVFALVLEWMNAPARARPIIRERIRAQVSAIVDDNLKERETRIANLRARLSEEEDKLAEDRKRKEQLVQNRLRMMIDLPAGQEPPADETPVNAAPADGK